jgi:hypothetical protein
MRFSYEYFLVELYFSQFFPEEHRGTYFIAHIATGSLAFLATNSRNIWFPCVPLGITVENKVTTEIF